MKTITYILLLLLTAALSPAVAQTPKLSSLPSAQATVFIDFDGQAVTATIWNSGGDINAASPGYSNAVITEIFNRVAEDYRPFNLNVTTDSTVYWAAPARKRMRIVVTPTSQWYGNSGGVAFVGSFTWGDNTPAFVFCALLGNNPKWVGEAVSHETGHTLGLQHQSVYDANCHKTAEYNTGLGTGEIGWAPIMGAGYYQNHTTWNIGPNTINCNTIQNDFDIISTRNGFGLRADDNGDNNATATDINFWGDAFNVSGLINTTADVDVFRITLTHATTLKLNAIPQNVGTGDDGANIDIEVTLLNGSDTINSYNPSTLLNAGVDTNLNAGTYYLVVDGVGNMYHDDAGSVGLYYLTGNIATALAVKNFNVTSTVDNDVHKLTWSWQADEVIKQVLVETSADGVHFTSLASLNASVKTYAYHPMINETIYYRLKAITASNAQAYLSNVTALKSKNKTAGIQVLNTKSADITVNSSDNFVYQLYTTGGQLLSKGRLSPGINQVPANGVKGLLLMYCSNGTYSFTQKLIKE